MSIIGFTRKHISNYWTWLSSVLCLAVLLAVGTTDTARANDLSWIPFENLNIGNVSTYSKKRSKIRRSKLRRSKYRKRRVSRRSRPRRAPRWKPHKSLKGPVQVVISLQDQHVTIFKGGKEIASSPISTGKAGYRTPRGIFSVIQKRRQHFSNLYNNAPMPHMQRITWSGVALHGGYVPNYPASHGCIRLPYGFAKKLFRVTKIGAQVVVGRDKALPTEFEHPKLFQPSSPETTAISMDGSAVDAVHVKLINSTDAPTVDETSTAAISMRKIVPDNKLIMLTRARPTSINLKGAIMDGVRRSKAAYSDASAVATKPLDEPASDSSALPKLKTKDSEAGEHGAQISKVRSNSPLRILVTRRTGRERLMDVQRLLIDLQYEPGPVDGVIGRMTRAAIKAFQKDKNLPQSGTVSDELDAELYRAAGKNDIKAGHLYVRQDYENVFDMAVNIRDPEKSLGTHIFTAMHFADGADKTRWMLQTVQERIGKTRKNRGEFVSLPVIASTAGEALDRIEMPRETRKRISEMLTPGSTLIVTDNGIGRETGRGTDFIVRTR